MVEMRYFVLVPASYAQVGGQTLFDRATAPRKPVRLSVMLEYPPADELMSVGGDNYLVTARLGSALEGARMRDYALDNVGVYKWDQFDSVSPEWRDRPLPQLRWLKVIGLGLKDDVGLHKNRLVVSDTALSFLKKFRIEECEVTPFESFLFSWEDRKKQLFERVRQRLKARGLGRPEW